MEKVSSEKFIPSSGIRTKNNNYALQHKPEQLSYETLSLTMSLKRIDW